MNYIKTSVLILGLAAVYFLPKSLITKSNTDGWEKLETQSQKTIETALTHLKKLSQNPKPMQPSQSKQSKQLHEEKFQTGLGFWIQSARSAFRTKERQPLLQTLAKNRQVLEHAKHILKDETVAKQKYGARQAEARVFAISVLSEAANQGVIGPIRRAAQQLASRLSSAEQISKGSKRDLEDLIAGYIKTDPHHFYDNLSTLMHQFHDSPAIHSALVVGIYLGLKDNFSKEEIEERFREAQINA